MCKWKPYSSQGSHESHMNKGPERTPSDARGQASCPPPLAAHREQGGPRTVTKGLPSRSSRGPCRSMLQQHLTLGSKSYPTNPTPSTGTSWARSDGQCQGCKTHWGDNRIGRRERQDAGVLIQNRSHRGWGSTQRGDGWPGQDRQLWVVWVGPHGSQRKKGSIILPFR